MTKTREGIIKEKLNKKSLSSEDVKQLLDLTGEKTFEHRFTKFCEVYGIPEPLFKSGRLYSFEPEWHGLFLVLMSTFPKSPVFHRDKAKQVLTLEKAGEYLKALREATEEYLPLEDRLDVESHPVYFRTIMEQDLIEQTKTNINRILTVLSEMPSDLRVSILSGVNRAVDSWLLHLTGLHATYTMEQEISDQDEIDEERSRLRDLEHLLQERLKNRMANLLRLRQEQRKRQELDAWERETSGDSADEQAAIDAMWERLFVAQAEEAFRQELLELVRAAREATLVEPSNAEIIGKVSAALADIKDARAEIVRDWCERVLLLLRSTELPPPESVPARYRQMVSEALFPDRLFKPRPQ